jgi:predicted sulfurtransferase
MRLLISIAAVMLVGVMALTACNSRETTPRIAKVAPTSTAPPPAGDNARRITPAELKDEIAKNDVVIIDVRGEAAYKQGHIKGSRQIPATEILAHVDELPKDKLIVTYCS